MIPMKNMCGAPAPHEYQPAAAMAVKYGEALYFSNGVLIKGTSTAVPEYISMFEGTTVSGQIIPVVAVCEDEIYETTLSAAGTSLKLGDKVTIATDAVRVTATTTDGVAEIVQFMGDKSSGSKVRIKF